MLQSVESSFNQVPQFVQFPAVIPRGLAIGPGWDYRDCSLLLDESHYLVAVIPLVPKHVISLDTS